jgi:accessory colonization factor AcfC
VRPSAILVRPDNPKDIRDFPDLLRPGINVMLVNGSGKSGLWENLTGRLQSLENLVALQKNVAVCAPDANEAMRVWHERQDIDAWIVWNVWHMPRRENAKVIPISEDYLIYREASVALTPRGKQSRLAAEFVDYLASREGYEVFSSWGWGQPPADASPAIAERGVCVACQIRKNVWINQVGRGLDRVRRLVEEYRALGIPPKDIHICALFDEDTAYWALEDEAYRRVTSGHDGNPNRMIVDELIHAGVSVEISERIMDEHGWRAGDLLNGVNIIHETDERIAELGGRGYSYLSF